MDGLPVIEQTGLAFASKVKATSVAGIESGVMHACGHDTHMTGWIGTARRMAAMKAQWSGTLVMIAPARRGDRRGRQGDARRRPLHPLPQADPCDRLPRRRLASGRSDRLFAGLRASPMSTASTSRSTASAATAPIRIRRATRSCSPAGSSARSRPWSAARSTRSSPAVVTVGSFHAGAKHNIISDEAMLLLTVRSYNRRRPAASCSTGSSASPAARRSPPESPRTRCRW